MVRVVFSREMTFGLRPPRSQRVRCMMRRGKRGHACNSLDALTLGVDCVSHHLLLDEVARGSGRQMGFGFSNSSPPMCAD